MIEPDFQKFIEKFPPLKTSSASDELIERYINVVPNDLLNFWKEHGFGTYGDGFIQIINPDDYRETLNMWLLREDDGLRIPFAMSAFGDMFYWRHIFNPNPSEDFPEWVFDVSYFDPHTSETGLCTYTMGEFFGDYLMQDFAQQIFKREFHSGFAVGLMEDDLNGELNRGKSSLFDRSLKKLGALEPGEMYFFVPALRLGGIDDVEYVEKGDALVQLNILFQLTGEDGGYYDDNFDFYEETDKLNGDPAQFDQRIAELKAEMDGTNNAHNHYMIGKLLDEYPCYDASIQNRDEVVERTKKEAAYHHNKAKELDPENPKYFYASFKSILTDYNSKNWDSALPDLQNYYDLTGNEEEYFRGRFDVAQMKNSGEEMLDFAEKLYEITSNYNELLTAAFTIKFANSDKAEEIYKRIIADTFDFYYAREATFGLAEIYRERKQEDMAMRLFDELYAKFPGQQAEIYNQIGVFHRNSYHGNGRLEKAYEYFLKAANSAEENSEDGDFIANYWHNVYSVLNEKNDFEGAKNAIEKTIEFCDDPFYQDERARLLYKMGLEDEAKESYSNSEYSDQNFSKQFDEENWQEIVWSLQNSVKAFDIKIQKIESELLQSPNDAKKQFLLAKILEDYPIFEIPSEEQENRRIEIVKRTYSAYTKAIELDSINPDYQLEFANFIYHNHFNLGIEDEERDRLMRGGYQFYIDHSENPVKGYEGLMWTSAYIDDYENVAKYSRLAYESDPAEIHMLIRMGDAYRELGRFPEAMNAFQEYLQQAQHSYDISEGKQGLAETYISMGEKDRAENLIEDLANSAENEVDRARFYHAGAEAFRMREDFDSAIKFQEKAVFFAEKCNDLFEKSSQMFDLAGLYENKGNLNEAIAIMKKLCSSRGESYHYSYLGRLLRENGNTDEARAALEKSLGLDPTDDYSKELLAELGNKKRGFFGKWF